MTFPRLVSCLQPFPSCAIDALIDQTLTCETVTLKRKQIPKYNLNLYGNRLRTVIFDLVHPQSKGPRMSETPLERQNPNAWIELTSCNLAHAAVVPRLEHPPAGLHDADIPTMIGTEIAKTFTAQIALIAVAAAVAAPVGMEIIGHLPVWVSFRNIALAAEQK